MRRVGEEPAPDVERRIETPEQVVERVEPARRARPVSRRPEPRPRRMLGDPARLCGHLSQRDAGHDAATAQAPKPATDGPDRDDDEERPDERGSARRPTSPAARRNHDVTNPRGTGGASRGPSAPAAQPARVQCPSQKGSSADRGLARHGPSASEDAPRPSTGWLCDVRPPSPSFRQILGRGARVESFVQLVLEHERSPSPRAGAGRHRGNPC